jgi:hypothetical protein
VQPAVQVEGLKELRAGFRSTGDRALPKALAKANKLAAQVVVEEALPNVPFRSGRLRATVKALGSQTAGKAKAGAAKVPYAAAVHWGTGPRPGLRGPHNIARNPFLVDAADRVNTQIVDQYEKEIDRILDGIRNA